MSTGTHKFQSCQCVMFMAEVGNGGIPSSFAMSDVTYERATPAPPSLPDGTGPFDAIYAAYRPLLRHVAVRRFGVPVSDADDLVHDVFATFLLRRSQVRDARAYLFGAIRNASQQYGRRGDASPTQPLPESDELPSGEQLADDVIRALTVHAALARLGAACRETLYRFHVIGEKASVIAESREQSENYIYRLLNYCRNRARAIYQEMNGERPS